MLAYREHIKLIQEEINRLKLESEDQRYMEIKKEKIETLEGKLN